MARYLGMLQISGRVGDLIFYIRNGKQYVRRYGKPDSHKQATAPAYEVQRNNTALFGFAAVTGKLIRAVFAPQATLPGCATLNTRLLTAVRGAIISEDDYVPGYPQFNQGAANRLSGFNWHARHGLPQVLRDACTPTIDLLRGRFELVVGATDFGALMPNGSTATHIRVKAVLATVQVGRNTSRFVVDESGLLPLQHGRTGEFLLEGKLPIRAAGSVLLLGVGLEACILMNGKPYPLMDGSSFALL